MHLSMQSHVLELIEHVGDGDTQPNGFCTHCKINEYTCTYAPKVRILESLRYC